MTRFTSEYSEEQPSPLFDKQNIEEQDVTNFQVPKPWPSADTDPKSPFGEDNLICECDLFWYPELR